MKMEWISSSRRHESQSNLMAVSPSYRIPLFGFFAEMWQANFLGAREGSEGVRPWGGCLFVGWFPFWLLTVTHTLLFLMKERHLKKMPVIYKPEKRLVPSSNVVVQTWNTAGDLDLETLVGFSSKVRPCRIRWALNRKGCTVMIHRRPQCGSWWVLLGRKIDWLTFGPRPSSRLRLWSTCKASVGHEAWLSFLRLGSPNAAEHRQSCELPLF